MADHDVIIVGGGVQGLMAALEAARRGLRPLVLERDTLGAGASTASLGIVHGGLRYLQALDLPRWRRSRREQRWFAREFGAHCRPLICHMPLYRRSARSPSLFRAAFLAERLLAGATHAPSPFGLPRVLPGTDDLPALVPRASLIGCAQWTELALDDAPALLRDIAGRIERLGGTVRQREAVVGLDGHEPEALAVTTVTGTRERRYQASRVLLCVGASSRALARRLDRDVLALSARALAFNLLLDRPMPSEAAIALSVTPGRGRSYFLRDHGGRMLAGTFYHPLGDDLDRSRPDVPAALVERAMDELIRAAPALRGSEVVETWAGMLPDLDRKGHQLRNKDLIHDHGRHDGPRGLYTLLGTKLTTAHALAVTAIDRAFGIVTALSDPKPRKAAA